MGDGREHIRSHQVKLSPEPFDWGWVTLCGIKVKFAKTVHSGHLTCMQCLKLYMLKKEMDLKEMQNILKGSSNEEN